MPERMCFDVINALTDCDTGQGGAAAKRSPPEGGNAVTYRHASERGAVTKRGVPDLHHTVGDDYFCQGGATRERPSLDGGDGSEEAIRERFTSGELNQSGVIFVVEYSVQTGKGGISGIYADIR